MILRVERIALEEIVTAGSNRTPGKRFVEDLGKLGQLHPILVRELAPHRYSLIDGSNRVATARGARETHIDAIVVPAGYADLPDAALNVVINTQRRSLTQIYLGRHARELVTKEGWSQVQVARLFHLSEATVSTLLRVLDCPEIVQAVEEEGLEFGAAKALMALEEGARAELLTELRALRQQTGKFPSVRRVEQEVRRKSGDTTAPPLTRGTLKALVDALEERDASIGIQTTLVRKNGTMKVMLTIPEAESEWIQRLVASAGTP